jgi:ABC-type multidrug transport system fused ATPase/permease subunit
MFIAIYATYFGMVIAGRRLHNDMLERLMRAPMWYFDTTPLGRIVNRFSKDIDLVDSAIPNLMRFTINAFFLSLVLVLLVRIIRTFILYQRGHLLMFNVLQSIVGIDSFPSHHSFSHSSGRSVMVY